MKHMPIDAKQLKPVSNSRQTSVAGLPHEAHVARWKCEGFGVHSGAHVTRWQAAEVHGNSKQKTGQMGSISEICVLYIYIYIYTSTYIIIDLYVYIFMHKYRYIYTYIYIYIYIYRPPNGGRALSNLQI